MIGLEGKRMGSSEKGKGLAEGRRGRSAEPPEVSVALDVTNERLLILRRSPPLNDGLGGLAKELRSCGRPPSDSRLKDADPQRRAGWRVPPTADSRHQGTRGRAATLHFPAALGRRRSIPPLFYNLLETFQSPTACEQRSCKLIVDSVL